MNEIIKQKHPSGRTIVFNEQGHRYYFEDNPNEVFISVTTFLKKFFEEFDIENISKKYALKNGLDQNDVKKQWREKGHKSRILGNKCHNFVDFVLKGEEIPTPKDKIEQVYLKHIKNTLKKTMRDYTIVGSEVIVASTKYKIAGAIDLLYRNLNTLYLIDWKTVIKIDLFSSFNKYALSPIDTLDDCNFNKFALQLNLYKYFLREENYFPMVDNYKMYIKHITRYGCDEIQVPDMSEEVKKLLNYKKIT